MSGCTYRWSILAPLSHIYIAVVGLPAEKSKTSISMITLEFGGMLDLTKLDITTTRPEVVAPRFAVNRT